MCLIFITHEVIVHHSVATASPAAGRSTVQSPMESTAQPSPNPDNVITEPSSYPETVNNGPGDDSVDDSELKSQYHF